MIDNTTPLIPDDRREIENLLSQLKVSFENEQTSPKSWGGTNNVRSPKAILSDNLVNCYSCTYCTDCRDSVLCTQCIGSTRLMDCRFCIRSHRCSTSAYLIMSTNCHDCTFCFACVGLVSKEYHILNQPVSEKEYFERLPHLKQMFGIPSTSRK